MTGNEKEPDVIEIDLMELLIQFLHRRHRIGMRDNGFYIERLCPSEGI